MGGPINLAGSGALVVAGGDGTLHHTVGQLLLSDIAAPPIYHLPLGTENLFAREFGMTRDPAILLSRLADGRVTKIDVGFCNGRPFLLMCGVGPDAGVLARLNAAASRGGRRGPITHRSYIRPILQELWSMRVPTLSISIDGQSAVRRSQGLLIVGNSRQYAVRMDPAAAATMSDGLLDAVFMPTRGRLGIIGWAAAARLRLHLRSRSLIYRTGRTIEVGAASVPLYYQLDGEHCHCPNGRLSVSIRPGALRVWGG